MRLEKIQRDFLWRGGWLVKKIHLVKWSTVCLEKSMDELEIWCIFLLNKAFLCKWSWWYATKKGVFRRKQLGANIERMRVGGGLVKLKMGMD